MVAEVHTEPDSGYARLESQISWYDSKSGSAQAWHKRATIGKVLVASSIPICALYGLNVAAATLGGLIVVIEAVQQLNQWQHNWVTYRSTCEALRHEKYTYLGRVGPYDDIDDSAAFKVLVERIESLISTEHSKWVGRLQNEKMENGCD
ncbi:DUF4231 domain-containing protein [Sphingomonas adhaesiva]|uniref:DUF4231 domain-containing protein n=1 Tax=Sphingomonas adhaesiva TaxID=28212 RepID=UPI002FFB5881